MAKDISKKVVLVMLVIAIVMSVSGTWLVLENVDAARTRGFVIQDSEAGNLRLTIANTNLPDPEPSFSSGNVGIVIQ